MKGSEAFLSRNKLLEVISLFKQNSLTTNQTVKQKKIVDAASKLFAEKGYSNTSTSEIAKPGRGIGRNESKALWNQR